ALATALAGCAALRLRAAGGHAPEHALPLVPPGRACDRAVRVAKLEVHACARRAQVHELADQLQAAELAQPPAQGQRVLADGERSREAAARDPVLRGSLAHVRFSHEIPA